MDDIQKIYETNSSSNDDAEFDTGSLYKTKSGSSTVKFTPNKKKINESIEHHLRTVTSVQTESVLSIPEEYPQSLDVSEFRSSIKSFSRDQED